ncbi:FMN-dependent NADH-azoreductase [Peribacillus alkalitolerans]|uniref:FMN-dependent NADH-azoreductase n=1 Tax=Peribacillus alkalitolerans TaxID=1550385 RepID=UPI0013D6A655|nr:FMN-dependent NADH-azoreductase [Peribacillus alkalitolerans]
MTKVLYVKANPKEDHQSFSARVANDFLDAYKTEHPEDMVEVLDLYNSFIPLIDGDVLQAWGKLANGHELTDDEASKVSRLGYLVDQFLAADKVVFSAPMWNFGFPPLMKAYLDAVCVAGKTFKYTAEGPVGLVEGKEVLMIEARGGIYSEGPMRQVEHTESYFKTVMNFIGISQVQTIIVEGVALDPSKAEDIYHAAASKAKELASQF